MNVVFTDEQDDPLEPEPLIALTTAVLMAEGFPDGTELSLTLLGAEAMAAYNADHLGRQGPTDVISFPLEDLIPGSPTIPAVEGPPLHLGDVFICPEVVRANAASRNVPFDDELALLVVHGVLHLLGYDHVAEADAERMEARERDLLSAGHGSQR